MFAALAAVATHLRSVPHFQSWDVRDGLSVEPRAAKPAVDVRYRGASVGDAKGVSSVNVSPVLEVTLIVPRGPDAAADLDAAFTAAIAALHGYRVHGASATRDGWTPFTLAQVLTFEPVDQEVACQLLFTHSKRFAFECRAGC